MSNIKTEYSFVAIPVSYPQSLSLILESVHLERAARAVDYGSGLKWLRSSRRARTF